MNCVNIKIVKEESTPVDKLVPFERDELVRSTSMLRTSWPYQCEIHCIAGQKCRKGDLALFLLHGQKCCERYRLQEENHSLFQGIACFYGIAVEKLCYIIISVLPFPCFYFPCPTYSCRNFIWMVQENCNPFIRLKFFLQQAQASQAQNVWCMGQPVYIENCMGKSPIVKNCINNYLIGNKVFLP